MLQGMGITALKAMCCKRMGSGVTASGWAAGAMNMRVVGVTGVAWVDVIPKEYGVHRMPARGTGWNTGIGVGSGSDRLLCVAIKPWNVVS